MVEYIFACSCWWGVRKVSSRSIPKTPHSSNLSSPRLPYSVGGMYDDGKGSPRYHPTHTFRRGLKVQRCIHKIVDSQFPPPKKSVCTKAVFDCFATIKAITMKKKRCSARSPFPRRTVKFNNYIFHSHLAAQFLLCWFWMSKCIREVPPE